MAGARGAAGRLLRIGMVVWNHYAPDRRVHNETRTLLRLGHEVEVVALRASVEDPEVEEMDGVVVRRFLVPRDEKLRSVLSPLFHRITAPRMVRWLHKLRYDRLHVHDLDGLVTGVQYKRRFGTPFVYDAHEADYGSMFAKEKGPLPRWFKSGYANRLERRLGAKAERIVVNSRYALPAKEHLERPLHVVPFRADPRWFTPAAGPPSRDPPLAIYTGGIYRSKGFQLMLDAWRILKEEGTRCDLEVRGNLGANLSRADLDAMLRERGIQDTVKVSGWVPYEEIPKHLHQARVGFSLIAPDVRNHVLAMPNKVMDYVACGLPLVLSPIPSHREIVERYGCGTVIPEMTPKAVARGVQEVLAMDPVKVRQACLEASRERFPWEDLERSLAEVHPRA